MTSKQTDATARIELKTFMVTSWIEWKHIEIRVLGYQNARVGQNGT
jgi:hypothetical protein